MGDDRGHVAAGHVLGHVGDVDLADQRGVVHDAQGVAAGHIADEVVRVAVDKGACGHADEVASGLVDLGDPAVGDVARGGGDVAHIDDVADDVAVGDAVGDVVVADHVVDANEVVRVSLVVLDVDVHVAALGGVRSRGRGRQVRVDVAVLAEGGGDGVLQHALFFLLEWMCGMQLVDRDVLAARSEILNAALERAVVFRYDLDRRVVENQRRGLQHVCRAHAPESGLIQRGLRISIEGRSGGWVADEAREELVQRRLARRASGGVRPGVGGRGLGPTGRVLRVHHRLVLPMLSVTRLGVERGRAVPHSDVDHVKGSGLPRPSGTTPSYPSPY